MIELIFYDKKIMMVIKNLKTEQNNFIISSIISCKSALDK
jgi:hypothetical protein